MLWDWDEGRVFAVARSPPELPHAMHSACIWYRVDASSGNATCKWWSISLWKTSIVITVKAL
jgi:hypothetical protein